MRKILFIGVFLLAISPASAQQVQDESVYGNCFSTAEGTYMLMSERIISLFQSTAIDRFEFEKYRNEIIHRRESDLRYCSERETQRLTDKLKAANQHLDWHREAASSPSGRAPASVFNPAYDEVESHYDVEDED